MFGKKKKPVEEICKNCRLFDGPTSVCKVRLVVSGQVFRDIPVEPEDKCLWEEMGVADEIKQVRFKTTEPEGGGHGSTTIEYPADFFGKEKGD